MSDDLAERLRGWPASVAGDTMDEAADRIKELQAEVNGAHEIILSERAEVLRLRERIEELEERLKAATDDAKEAEAYAEQLENVLIRKKAKLAKAVEAMGFALDTLGEINPSNYDHDDVCNLNDKSVEVIIYLSTTLAKLKGQDDGDEV